MRLFLPLAALLSLSLLGASLPDAGAVENDSAIDSALLAVSVGKASLPQSLNALPERAKVRIGAVPLDAQGGRSVALNLEKFTVFAPDAVVVVDSGSRSERRLAPPAMAHFRGEVDGYPGSSVFWSVDENGHMKGILHFADGQIVVTEQTPGSATKNSRSTARPVEKSGDFAARDFQCGVDRQHTRDFIQRSRPVPKSALPPVAELTTTTYTARIAIETDYEFFQRLGSEAAATQYIADLFGYVSTVYAAEIKTNLQVGDVYLYTNSSDPWSAASTSAALSEVGNYWQANRSAVTRTLTHFMSGKNVNGGIAWVGTLCSSTYGYGVSMGLDGNFSAANPQIIWDSVVIAHEIGHNFGSSHTHEWDTYNGGSPIDCCYRNSAASGICSSAYGTLPGVGSLTGGTSGTGAGTLMSYCHLLTPGYMSNLSFTFGLNHSKGISPARVPTLMRTTVEEAVAFAPSCLVAGSTPSTYTLTVHSTGAASVAIGASPTTYAGTSDYSKTGIAAGTSLTLSAPATVGSATFSHWSGCDSASGVSCSLTLSASKSVTASYSSSTASNLLQNPGFESGTTAWTQISSGDYPLIVNGADYSPHSGAYYAWLGGYYSGTDRIEQSVTIPANSSSATVDFWYEIWTAETSSSIAHDTLKVELYNAAGVKLSTLTTLSNLNASVAGGWVKSPLFDVSAYKGQNLSLRFTASTDAALHTSFLVDDVSLSLSLTTAPPSGKGNKLGPMLMLLLN